MTTEKKRLLHDAHGVAFTSTPLRPADIEAAPRLRALGRLGVGFGRIGTRIARRCLAMEMRVEAYDPYVPAEAVRAAGCEPVAGLDAALPRADNPLFTLSNVIVAPHLAGNTRKSLDRRALTTVRNLLSALDGKPSREDVVNPDALRGQKQCR